MKSNSGSIKWDCVQCVKRDYNEKRGIGRKGERKKELTKNYKVKLTARRCQHRLPTNGDAAIKKIA